MLRPGEADTRSGSGSTRSPSGFMPIVHADSVAQGIELYFFDETNKEFRLPYNLALQPHGKLKLTASLCYFNPSLEQFKEKNKRATLRIDLADKREDPPAAFFLSLAGMNVYHHLDQNRIPSIGPQFFTPVQPGKEMVVESGVLQLKFNLWRHKPESVWSKIFGFFRKEVLPVLKPYLPLPNLVTPGVEFLNDMIGFSKSASKDEPIWESMGLDFVLTEETRQRLGHPFGFRSGYWVVMDKNAPNLTQKNSEVMLDPATGLLVSRQNPAQRVLLEHNYLVWRCHLASA